MYILLPYCPPPGNNSMERIRYARLKAQLTISELASASGVHQNSINLIELKKRNPCVTTIRLLAAALKQDIWYLGCYETLPTETLGQQLCKARLFHGLTKKEFAKQIGVNEKTIRLWKSDLCKLTSESMLRIKSFLHILSIQRK